MTSAIFLVAILVTVVYLSTTRADVIEDVHAGDEQPTGSTAATSPAPRRG